ncbi:hypothetical protein [Virgibacillus sp. YIM 98842]|jgi:hypothetical protein|nr:hypothetical protein [Virgibacillus sp. YIM 98842]
MPKKIPFGRENTGNCVTKTKDAKENCINSDFSAKIDAARLLNFSRSG